MGFILKSLLIINVPIIIALIAIFLQHPSQDEFPDLNRTIHELIESRGFKHESHFVTTAGGYILQVIRIVNPHHAAADGQRSKLKPVLLHHGFQCSGSFWLIGGEGRLLENGTYWEEGVMGANPRSVGNSLGFVLAARGYDVFLANYRGGTYSRNHTSLSPDDEAFWRYSIDEMTREDLPSLIEYVKDLTGKSSVGYIGHSQGNIMMFGLLATQPQYSASVKPFIALSPIFYSSKWRGPVTYLRSFTRWIRRLRPMRSTDFPYRRFCLPQLCTNPLLRRTLCFAVYYPTVGATYSQMDFNRLPVFLYNLGFGASTRNFVHIIQMTNRTNPTFFDYEDEEENVRRYGQSSPPEYPVGAINSSHIALIYTKNDWTNHVDNIDLLEKNLKVKLLDRYAVPGEDWGHNELVLAKDVGEFVNTRVLTILAKY